MPAIFSISDDSQFREVTDATVLSQVALGPKAPSKQISRLESLPHALRPPVENSSPSHGAHWVSDMRVASEINPLPTEQAVVSQQVLLASSVLFQDCPKTQEEHWVSEEAVPDKTNPLPMGQVDQREHAEVSTESE